MRASPRASPCRRRRPRSRRRASPTSVSWRKSRTSYTSETRRSTSRRPRSGRSRVGALIEAGADSNAENRRGATALHYACDARPKAGKTWNPSKQRSVIERLLDAGSDIEHKDKAGAAPLHRAVRARSPEAVRCLLERGARVDATHGRQRTTPLHIVTHSTGASGTKGAHAEQQEIVALLLRYGADPRARDAHGTLPRM